jgi:hypothetical protein
VTFCAEHSSNEDSDFLFPSLLFILLSPFSIPLSCLQFASFRSVKPITWSGTLLNTAQFRQLFRQVWRHTVKSLSLKPIVYRALQDWHVSYYQWTSFVFVKETRRVFCAVETEFLNLIEAIPLCVYKQI